MSKAEREKLDKFVTTQSQQSLVKSGNMKFEDYAKSDPEGANQLVQGGYKPDDSKEDDKSLAVSQLVDKLEEQYKKAGGGNYTGIAATAAGGLKGVLGALNVGGFEGARTYNRLRKGNVSAVKDVVGEVGNLTNQDIERVMGLLPSLSDNPETAKDLFNSMRQQLAAQYGQEASPSTFNPQNPKSLMGMLGLETSRRAANDIGVSIGQKQSGAVDAQNEALAMADKLDEKAKSLKGEDQKRTMKLAQDIRTKISGGSQELQNKYSEDIDKSYVQRGLQSGVEIASLADLVSSAPAIFKTTKNLVSGGGKDITKVLKDKSINPIKNIGDTRALEAAVEDAAGKVIEPEKLADIMYEKVIKDTTIPQSSKNKIIKDIYALGKKSDPISISQSVGEFAAADEKEIFGKLLRDSYKDIWEKEAPEVLKQTKKMGKTFKLGENLMNVLKLTGTAAGGIGGGAYLFNLLKGKK